MHLLKYLKRFYPTTNCPVNHFDLLRALPEAAKKALTEKKALIGVLVLYSTRQFRRFFLESGLPAGSLAVGRADLDCFLRRARLSARRPSVAISTPTAPPRAALGEEVAQLWSGRTTGGQNV